MTFPGVYSPEQGVNQEAFTPTVEGGDALVEIMAVAALLSLTEAGVSEDVLSMLNHGDGRGRIAPNAFRRAQRAALNALREHGKDKS